MNNSKVLRLLGVAGLAVLLATTALAQKKTREERREEATQRSVTGTITDDADNPVNGAVVQLKDMRSLAVRSFITQADGAYRFSGLKIDLDYQISVKAGELTAGPRTLSNFDSRKDPVLNFKLEKK